MSVEVADTVSKALTSAQLLAALLGGLGVGAWWRGATLAEDEKFVLELANYQASVARAEEIRSAAGTKAGQRPSAQASGATVVESEQGSSVGTVTPLTGVGLLALADTLQGEAERRLQYSIARTQWRRSKARNWAGFSFCVGLVLFVLGFYTLLFNWAVPGVPWPGTAAELSTLYANLSALSVAVGLVITTICKSMWLDAAVARMNPKDRPGRRRWLLLPLFTGGGTC